MSSLTVIVISLYIYIYIYVCVFLECILQWFSEDRKFQEGTIVNVKLAYSIFVEGI